MSLPARTVAEAEERYREAEALLRAVFNPEQVWADGRDMSAHLERYQRALRYVELMQERHDQIMKAVMGTHAAKLPLPSSLHAPLPEPLVPGDAPAPLRPVEPPLAVELLRLWISAWTVTPQDAAGVPRESGKSFLGDGFELLRRTKEFLEGVEVGGPPMLYYFITLRWPVLGGMGEGTFQGTLELNAGAKASEVMSQLFAKYADKLKVGTGDLVVLDFNWIPEEMA